MAESARQKAYEALVRVERDKAYSNIILDKLLSESGLTLRDKAFTSMLFYGVIEKKLLLDYNLSQLSDKPVNKLDKEILIILRMGLYQLFFADSVTDAAAVNESVKLCKTNRLSSASGFVNAVLRNAVKLTELRLPEKKKGKNKYYSIKYSCPEKIIKLWRSAYGDEITEGILLSLSEKPLLYARVNTLKITPEKLAERLEKKGIKTEKSIVSGNCIAMHGAGSVQELEEYREGLFHIQDAACQLCCGLLGAVSGDIAADVCAAPGGKSFTIAEIMNNKGQIISCDLYESRLRLVSEGANRLGINIIRTHAGDSSKLENMPQADVVLCDVPCSGLGIIRRKPELRYKDELGEESLPQLQYEILCSAASVLKKGGRLVYSTCTLNPAENGVNIKRFLSKHEEFEPAPLELPEGITHLIQEPENALTVFPQMCRTDGFFISAVRRKKA